MGNKEIGKKHFCYETLAKGALSGCDIWQAYRDNPYPPLRGPPSPEEKASRFTIETHKDTGYPQCTGLSNKLMI